MPDVIKLLPDSVANQIAAGEVIQRPASVVKELLENSIDAGGRKIEVIIKDSGKTLIQVTDNGEGMSETDARLAFERHATSKITKAQDLFSIVTKGFRGEALASVAAVSMVELRTRKEEDDTGTLIAVNGSRIDKQEPCSCPAGSTFSVKNLFFNIPARRKFLKSDNTELRHIIGEFQKVALAHPDIHFSLRHNDNEIYNLSPCNTRQRIVGLFGKQINNDLITIKTETTLISVDGFIGKPENAKRTYGEQFFFVNDRYMRHPYFHKAVIEAYHNILPPDTIPSYFIYFITDPSSIDINIHPTKTEIKFEDERSIWQILMASVREALGRFNITPSIDFENEALIDIPVKNGPGTFPNQPEIVVDRDFDPFRKEAGTLKRPDAAERFEKENITNWERLFSPPDKHDLENDAISTTTDSRRKLFQIRDKYIICAVKSGLMLIDQKRAHERILYEKYLDTLDKNHAVSQSDMFPVTAEFNPADIVILKEIENDMIMLGFNIRHSDDNKITISGLPANTYISDPLDLVKSLLEEYKNSQGMSPVRTQETIASAMATASAIPYGKRLSQNEMENLFDTLFSCSIPNYSPKGKTVICIIPLEEIDKRF